MLTLAKYSCWFRIEYFAAYSLGNGGMTPDATFHARGWVVHLKKLSAVCVAMNNAQIESCSIDRQLGRCGAGGTDAHDQLDLCCV